MDAIAIEAAVYAALAKTGAKPECKGMTPEQVCEALVTNSLPAEDLQPFVDIINGVFAGAERNSTEALKTPADLARFAGLTDLQLLAFRLHYGNGLNVKQIAQRMNISPKDASRHVVQAWGALRVAMYGKDAEPERAAMTILQRIACRMLGVATSE